MERAVALSMQKEIRSGPEAVTEGASYRSGKELDPQSKKVRAT